MRVSWQSSAQRTVQRQLVAFAMPVVASNCPVSRPTTIKVQSFDVDGRDGGGKTTVGMNPISSLFDRKRSI